MLNFSFSIFKHNVKSIILKSTSIAMHVYSFLVRCINSTQTFLTTENNTTTPDEMSVKYDYTICGIPFHLSRVVRVIIAC